MGVKEQVNAKIEAKKVMMFSKTYCPYCRMAKEALKGHVGHDLDSDDYEVWELEGHPDCGAIQDYLLQLTGSRTVPRVFINGKCIGGGTEIKAAQQSGKLAQMLATR